MMTASKPITKIEKKAAKAEKKKRFWKDFKKTKALLWFAIPPVIFYLLFKYYPIYGSQIAFRDYSPYLGFWGSEWVGLENFQRFFKSPDFVTILKNTLTISISSLIVGFPFPIILAIMINQLTNAKAKKIVQTITYAPYFISMVVLVGMMYTIFSTYGGVVNILIEKFGGTEILFMGEKKYYVAMYVISGVWQTSGWSAIVYIAALAGVSPDLHESAVVDGASRLKRIWYIDLPCIMPTIITMLILSAGQLLTVGFEKSYLMQNSMNTTVSEVITTYTYKRGLQDGDFSYASAVELFQSGINFFILVTVNKISRKFSDTSLW